MTKKMATLRAPRVATSPEALAALTKAARDDQHLITRLDPQQYRYIGYIDMKEADEAEHAEHIVHDPRGYSADTLDWAFYVYDPAVVEFNRKLQEHVERNHHKGHYADRGGCDVCGARGLRHVNVYEYKPDGDWIVMGTDCAGKAGLESKADVEMARAREREEARKRAAELLRKKEQWRASVNDPEGLALLDRLIQREKDKQQMHGILSDLVRKYKQYGSLSEKQMALMKKIDAEEELRQVEKENPIQGPKMPVPEGKGQTISGKIVSVKWQQSDYGSTLKCLVEDHRGFRLWGTVPGAASWEKGDEVSFTADVERSDDDEFFGFYKRPRRFDKVGSFVVDEESGQYTLPDGMVIDLVWNGYRDFWAFPKGQRDDANAIGLVSITMQTDPPKIVHAQIASGYRRKGIATALLRFARTKFPGLVHSHALTDDGKAWSQKVGASGVLYRGLCLGSMAIDDITRDPRQFLLEEVLDTGHEDFNPTSTASKRLGIHWTTNPSVAYNFALALDHDGWVPDDDNEDAVVGVVLEGKVSPGDRLNRNTKEHQDAEFFDGVLDYSIENEIVVRDAAMVTVTKATFVIRNHGGRWRDDPHEIVVDTPPIRMKASSQTLYWRAHPRKRPFSPENAWSTTFYSDQGTRQGYSCFAEPWALWLYLDSYKIAMGDSDIIAFTGERIGEGNDGEDLVIPDMKTVEKMSLAQFEKRIVSAPMPSSPTGKYNFGYGERMGNWKALADWFRGSRGGPFKVGDDPLIDRILTHGSKPKVSGGELSANCVAIYDRNSDSFSFWPLEGDSHGDWDAPSGALHNSPKFRPNTTLAADGAVFWIESGEIMPVGGFNMPTSPTMFNPMYVEALQRLADLYPKVGRWTLLDAKPFRGSHPTYRGTVWDFLTSVNEMRADYAEHNGSRREARITSFDLYHGTVGLYADKIMREGLKPRDTSGVANHWQEKAKSYDGLVYLSHSSRLTVSRLAMSAARKAAEEALGYTKREEAISKALRDAQGDSWAGKERDEAGIVKAQEASRRLAAEMDGDPRLDAVLLKVSIPYDHLHLLRPDEDTKTYTQDVAGATGMPEWMASIGSDAVVAYQGNIPASWITEAARSKDALNAGMYSDEGDAWRRRRASKSAWPGVASVEH